MFKFKKYLNIIEDNEIFFKKYLNNLEICLDYNNKLY